MPRRRPSENRAVYSRVLSWSRFPLAQDEWMRQQLPQRPTSVLGFTHAGNDQRVFRHEFAHNLPAGATRGQAFKPGRVNKDRVRRAWEHAGRNSPGKRGALRALGQAIGGVFYIAPGVDIPFVIHHAGAHPGPAVR